MKKFFIVLFSMVAIINANDILIQVASLKKPESTPIVKNNLLKLNLSKSLITEQDTHGYHVIYYKDIRELSNIQTKYHDAFLIHDIDIKNQVIIKSKRTIKIPDEVSTMTDCTEVYKRIHKKEPEEGYFIKKSPCQKYKEIKKEIQKYKEPVSIQIENQKKKKNPFETEGPMLSQKKKKRCKCENRRQNTMTMGEYRELMYRKSLQNQ